MPTDLDVTAQQALHTLLAGGIVCLRTPVAFRLLATEPSAVRRIRTVQDAGRFGTEWALVTTPEVFADVAILDEPDLEEALPDLLAVMPVRITCEPVPASRLLASLDPYLHAQVADADGVSVFCPSTAPEAEWLVLARIVTLAEAQGRLVLFACESGCHASDIALLPALNAELGLELVLDCEGE